MKLLSQWSVMATLAVALGGCSVFEDEKDEYSPADLVEFNAQFEPTIQWQKQVGDGVEKHFSRLTPAISKNIVYSASREGMVKAFTFTTGENLWSVDLRKDKAGLMDLIGSFGGLLEERQSARLSGGVTVAYDKVYIGNEHGEVIALNAADGAVVWRHKVKGEVISPPGAGEGLIIVNTAAGYLIALHPDTGEQRWSVEQDVPSLTLRGISTPVVASGGVVYGSADGKLSVVISESGLEAWKQSVATAIGSSELERLVDVDSSPIVSGDNIYALAFNGNLVAVDVRSGRINWKQPYSSFRNISLSGLLLYLTDYKGHIYAVSSADGTEVWRNQSLTNRGVTGVFSQGSYAVVGDSLGYLHWLNKETGEIVARKSMDSSGFYAEPVGDDNIIVVQTRDGEISVITTP